MARRTSRRSPPRIVKVSSALSSYGPNPERAPSRLWASSPAREASLELLGCRYSDPSELHGRLLVLVPREGFIGDSI